MEKEVRTCFSNASRGDQIRIFLSDDYANVMEDLGVILFKFNNEEEAKSHIIILNMNVEHCANCNKTANEQPDHRLSLCGRCKLVKYCSKECQITHWKKIHRAVCNSMA